MLIEPAVIAARSGGRTARTNFLDLWFDSLGEDAVLGLLARDSEHFRYVVTPNVDHVVRLHSADQASRQVLRSAYQNAELCLCDSRILRQLAARQGIDLALVPGSDLTRRLFDEVIGEGDLITIVGGGDELVRRLQARWPKVRFRHHAPPMAMLRDEAAMEAAARFVAEHPARFCFLAVGSPQQELLALRVLEGKAACGTALCVGASLEFLVGLRARAPRLMQTMHLEWLHRLISQPHRMWRRYIVEGPKIFLLSARWGKSASD